MRLRALPARVSTLKDRRIPLLAFQPKAPSWRSEKTSSTERGYGYAWQKARVRFLAAHPLCVMCEDEGRTIPATVVDHKIPHRGDQQRFWDEDNWQSLCSTHHSSHKQRMENQT